MEIFRVIKLKATNRDRNQITTVTLRKRRQNMLCLIKSVSELELSCLLAGGGAEHHRWQCFPHGVRGAASASADPSGCNLAAIDAILSQGQAGASNVVGTFQSISKTGPIA